MTRAFSVLALWLLVLGTAHAQAPAAFTVDTSSSKLTYHLIHKMHKVTGVSRRVAGKAMISPDGKAQVVLKVPVESFDSENVNRDAHMKETVDAIKYPAVELKAVGETITPPTTFPTTIKKPFKVQLSFHGETQVFEVPVEIIWEAANRVRAKAAFSLSLEAYKIERPSLMFIKVEDELKMEAEVLFTR